MKKQLQPLVKKFGTQDAAARACGVTPSTFNRWWTGKSKPRGENTWERLRGLGVRQ